MRHITSVCRKCIIDKKEAKRLPCLALYEEWERGNKPNVKEVMCRTGPFGWCPKFCGLPDRIIEMKVKQYLAQDVVSELKTRYLAEAI